MNVKKPFFPLCLLLTSCTVTWGGSLASSSESSTDSSLSSSASSTTSSSSAFSSEASSSLPSTMAKARYAQLQKSGVSLTSDEGFHDLFSAIGVQIKITFTPEAAKAVSHYGTEEDGLKYQDVYFPATFELKVPGHEAIAYEDVGVRMKGNTSRRAFVDNDGRITCASHLKVSFKETFDDAIYDLSQFSSFKKTYATEAEKNALSNRTLFGLKKLDFKYVPRNGSCVVREPYAYSVYDKAGCLAAESNLAEVKLTAGVNAPTYDYEIVEPIDKTFLKRRFSKADAKGDLYKCVYGWMGPADLNRDNTVAREYDASGFNVGTRVAKGKIGVEDSLEQYHPSYQLKTNDDDGEASDFSSMVNYINAMWSLVNANAPKTVLESALDVDSFLTFEAVSYLLGNPDSQRRNANNYYIYFVPSTGKAIYIPYDWDWCLGLDYTDEKVVNFAPFNETYYAGSTAPNVYRATYYKSNESNLAYDAKGYQNQYLASVKALAPTVLSYASFSEMASAYGQSSECSSVSAYMRARKSIVDSAS